MSGVRRIDLDQNATTPVSEAALAAMMPALRELHGNPSSLHHSGTRARAALEGAREAIAAELGARASEISFTSGATESINWAIRGAAAAKPDRPRVVTTAVEHPVTSDVVRRLAREGREAVVLSVDAEGRLDLARVADELDERVAMLSVIGINNETGVRFDVVALGELARERGVPFHVDAAQWVGKERIDLSTLPVDFLSFSGHKFGAPKGTGVLYARRGARLRPFVWGGHQEMTRRSGTENVPGILGMAAALPDSLARWDRERDRIAAARDRLEAGLAAAVPGLRRNGAGAPRAANTANVCFPGIEGAAVVLSLSAAGIDCSSGSACSASDPGPSPVLVAMGVPGDLIHGAVRFSLGPGTSDADVDTAVEAAIAAWRHVARVRT
ncbi:MAG: cysteine desulfurase family protein [Planctomycetota bacterium]